eukprot:ANDGO_08136.mRNA.1 hypothetical protein DICPUDRAFT_79738
MEDVVGPSSKVPRATKSSSVGGGGDGDGGGDFPLRDTFSKCASQLELHYERKERVFKQSRDVTAQSKKIVFSIHREEPLQLCLEKIQVVAKNIARIVFELVSECVDFSEAEAYRYVGSLSSGIQEWVEAVSFYYYIAHGQTLVPKQFLDDVLAAAADAAALGGSRDREPHVGLCKALLMVSWTDYVSGLCDLTGELMKYATSNVRNQELVFHVTEFVGCMLREFQAIQLASKPSASGSGLGLRDLGKKLEVMEQSLRKLESLCYTIRIRGSEYSPDMLAGFADSIGGGSSSVDE